MTEDRMRERLAEIERMIEEAHGWGAYVSVLYEEARALRATLAETKKGDPKAALC
jgi:hypothetical protein